MVAPVDKPKRKAKGKSPTARSLELLRGRGYRAEVVEKTIPHTFIKRDLFNVIDIIAIKKGETVAVQATDGSNVSHRIAKIAEAESVPDIRDAGWSLFIHGWSKNAAGRWVVREVNLS